MAAVADVYLEDVSKGLASGVGFGRVVCPEVRKKNNTHHTNKPSLLE
jgi:hypothetical protein